MKLKNKLLKKYRRKFNKLTIKTMTDFLDQLEGIGKDMYAELNQTTEIK